jgi:hyperosmotically inducible protein
VTDSWITTKVKAQFIGVDALKNSDISVDTNQNGVVTLTGTVPNDVARAKAVEIVRTTKGVRRVVDEMKPSAR